MKKISTICLMLLSLFALPSFAASLIVNDPMENALALLSANGGSVQNGVSTASILWKYEIALNDSSDAAKKTESAQRSTNAEYLVDCTNQTIALSKWQMYSDAEGMGQVVWSDQINENADFYQPVRKAERSLVSVACEMKTALK